MNIHLLAADIARRIPEMQADSVTNNATVIERMILDEIERVPNPTQIAVDAEEYERLKTIARQTDDILNTLDDYGRTQPDVLAAVEAAMKDVTKYRLIAWSAAHLICDLWDNGELDHEQKDCPQDDTCTCKIPKLANEAYKLTGRDCLA